MARIRQGRVNGTVSVLKLKVRLLTGTSTAIGKLFTLPADCDRQSMFTLVTSADVWPATVNGSMPAGSTGEMKSALGVVTFVKVPCPTAAAAPETKSGEAATAARRSARAARAGMASPIEST